MARGAASFPVSEVGVQFSHYNIGEPIYKYISKLGLIRPNFGLIRSKRQIAKIDFFIIIARQTRGIMKNRTIIIARQTVTS